MYQFLTALFMLVTCVTAFQVTKDVNSVEQTATTNVSSDRDERLFFSTMRILPLPCNAIINDIAVSGVCLVSLECERNQGTAQGDCANSLAVCCVLTKSCGRSSNNNHTLFVSPNYPEVDRELGACSLTINRMSQDICQIRVDFLQLELSQPDQRGICNNDFLTITGGISNAPIICGKNTGQHLYVDIDRNGAAVKITVDRASLDADSRAWNVQVSQIACDSAFRAPRGCLQQYTATSGIVKSFNFDATMEEQERSTPLATRQISQMDYSVCIHLAEGYCSIMWTQDPTAKQFGFTVSHNVDGIDPELIGTRSASTRGINCTQDYVVIPGGVEDDTGLSNDRFCGMGFPNTVRSSMKPFILYVKTDDDEKTDTLNRGFSLRYRQTIC